MDGKPDELGSGFAAAQVHGHKGELCATQLFLELVLRAVSPQHQVVGSDGNSSSGCGALHTWYHQVMAP